MSGDGRRHEPILLMLTLEQPTLTVAPYSTIVGRLHNRPLGNYKLRAISARDAHVTTA